MIDCSMINSSASVAHASLANSSTALFFPSVSPFQAQLLSHTSPRTAPHRTLLNGQSTHAPGDRYVMRGLGQYCDAKVVDDTPWPTCETHLSLVTEYDTWYGWVCESAHTPHGNVHIWIGGMLNCDQTIGNLSDLVGKENADLLKANAINRKGYWREELYQCEGFADEDMPLEEVRVRVGALVCVYVYRLYCYFRREPCFCSLGSLT